MNGTEGSNKTFDSDNFADFPYINDFELNFSIYGTLCFADSILDFENNCMYPYNEYHKNDTIKITPSWLVINEFDDYYSN
jgi:hypothetical protein